MFVCVKVRLVLGALLVAGPITAQDSAPFRGADHERHNNQPTVALSDPLRAHLRNERLDRVTSIRGLPLGVRNGLQTLFDSDMLDIAEPGADFQIFAVVGDSKLPIRRLVAAGCSIDHCLVYYERAGSAPTWHVALFHWTPDATRFESGGLAPARLATIGDARNALLTGTLKDSTKRW